MDLDTANESVSQANSEESENQSDLEENLHLVAKKSAKNGARLTGVRKEHPLASKDSRLNKESQPLNSQQAVGQKRQRKANPVNDPPKCIVEDEGKQSNLELLRKIFPNLSTAELAASLSNSNGELVKAIQHLVLKKQSMGGKQAPDDHQQVAFKQQSAFIDQDSIAKRKGNAAPFGNSTSKQGDGLLLNDKTVLTSLKTNLQTNLQHMQGNLTVAAQKPTAHSPLFNSPCQSPLSGSLHSQLFKEAFRANSNLFFTTTTANPAKTTDTLCSPAAASGGGGAIQQVPNSSSALNSISNSISNSIQVNHLLAQHSPGNPTSSASYLSMLASMSNQVENNCFNNQNLFDPILHPLNDAMLAMANQQQQQQLNKRNGLYNGGNQMPPAANNKNGNHSNNSLTLNNQLTSAFQRSILNETNNNGAFPYPLYPFLFSTAAGGDLTARQTDNSLKSSLVAAIAQQKVAHIQQAGLNGAAGALQTSPFPPNEAMLMGTFGHLLGEESGDLKAVKEKDTSLTSGSSQCSSPETSSRSPIKYGA